MEFSLLWSAALGFCLAWAMLRRTKRYPDPSALIDPLWGATAIGVFAGRIGSMIASGTNPLTSPGDILLVRGGVSTVVATIAALAFWAYSLRADLWRASDAAAPAVLAGLAGWHAGCVFRDACTGTVTDLPWAITLSGSTIGRHPVELYTAVLLLVSAALVRRMKMGSGAAAAAALAAAGLVRLATEPLRASISGGPLAGYVAAVAVGGVTAVLLIRRHRPEAAGQPGSTLAE